MAVGGSGDVEGHCTINDPPPCAFWVWAFATNAARHRKTVSNDNRENIFSATMLPPYFSSRSCDFALRFHWTSRSRSEAGNLFLNRASRFQTCGSASRSLLPGAAEKIGDLTARDQIIQLPL